MVKYQNPKSLNGNLIWALNKKGQAELQKLVDEGIDEDLAFELLMVHFEEKEILDLPGKKDER